METRSRKEASKNSTVPPDPAKTDALPKPPATIKSVDATETMVPFHLRVLNSVLLATGFKRQVCDESLLKEQQTLQSNSKGSIWNCIVTGNVDEAVKLIASSPSEIYQRGAVGELPLHLCALFNGAPQLNIMWKMIETNPKLILEPYNGAEYCGENVLHIAIVRQNFQLVQKLVDFSPALLHASATGSFFQRGKPCYYGEFPLAFAVCTNQLPIVDFLLARGANLDEVDGNKNNLLHLCVVHGLQELYAILKQKWIDMHGTSRKDGKIEPWNGRNHEGHTPFTLAAHLGSQEMFDWLLEERRQVQWSYGPITCLLYPLDQLDLEMRNEHGTMTVGALEEILNEGHINLLVNPRVLDLVAKKWERFAKHAFRKRLSVVSLYLINFTLFTIQRQNMFKAMLPGATPLAHWEHTVFFVQFFVVAIGAAWKGVKEFGECYNSGIRNYFSAKGSASLENILSLSYVTCIALFTLSHCLSFPFERMFLGMASLVAYSYLFFFLLAYRLTGPMVIMIFTMLTNDVFIFIIIYSVFVFGFGQAFFVLLDGHGTDGFLASMKTCFVASLGDFDISAFSDSSFQSVTVILLIIYVVVVSILLINLLIAMMGNTYGRINEEADNTWQLEQARIIFAIENEMSTAERMHESNQYFVTINNQRFIQVEVEDKNFFKTKKTS